MDSEIVKIKRALISRNQLHNRHCRNGKWLCRVDMEQGSQILSARLRNNSMPQNVIRSVISILHYLKNENIMTTVNIDEVVEEIRPYFSEKSFGTY